MKSFEDIGLIPELEKVVKERGFVKPSNIQEQSIPILTKEKTDFIGLAQTGTGKTAAFGLPLLQKIDVSKSNTQGIILCPTRELAIQTFNELRTFSKYLKKITFENVYGGTPVHAQAKRIRKKAPHIIVGTPGRVIDLLKRKSILLNNVNFFILDEADEMLNMGFEQDIKEILEYASKDANTWLFSATMPKSIRGIINKYMDDPKEVAVNTENKVNTNIKHLYSFVNRENKFDKLTYIIDKADNFYGVIFCRMKSETEKLAKDLNDAGYRADAINGDLSQSKREQVIKRFRKKQTHILAASDVAARGLDIKNLTHVIHYALPDTFEYYTHRSGRTGRAGELGISIAFVGRKDIGRLKRMEKALKIRFEEYHIDLKPPTAEEKVEDWYRKNEKKKDNPAPKVVAALEKKLEEWSREDLLALIANTQLLPSHRELKYQMDHHHNFRSVPGNQNFKQKRNVKKLKKKDRRKTVDRSRNRSKNPNHTDIFINIGYSDGFGDVALEDFISKNTGISKTKIGAFEVNKRYSLFGLEKSTAKHLQTLFKDVALKGRRIIAKIDEDQ